MILEICKLQPFFYQTQFTEQKTENNLYNFRFFHLNLNGLSYIRPLITD